MMSCTKASKNSYAERHAVNGRFDTLSLRACNLILNCEHSFYEFAIRCNCFISLALIYVYMCIERMLCLELQLLRLLRGAQ